MQAKFRVGQTVNAVAFVDCFGKDVPAVPNLTVTEVNLVEPLGDTLPPYYRVRSDAFYPKARVSMIEGAERFFEAT